MRLGKLGVTLVFAAFVAACTAGQPSDAEIERLVRTHVGAAGDDPVVELRDFDRIDGRVADGPRYVAEIEYTLVYLKSSDELREALGKELGRELAKSEDGDDPASDFRSQLNSTMKTMASGLGIFALSVSSFERGDTKEVRTTVALERWESGWKLAD